VQNHNTPATELAARDERAETADATESTAAQRPWQVEVGQLLQRAAALCSEHGVEVDAYMSGAWSAYIEARPGMREQLEEAQLRDQLDELRRLGRMGEA
jgi:hypothetical protein